MIANPVLAAWWAEFDRAEDPAGATVSLHDLWRAAGSPAGAEGDLP